MNCRLPSRCEIACLPAPRGIYSSCLRLPRSANRTSHWCVSFPSASPSIAEITPTVPIVRFGPKAEELELCTTSPLYTRQQTSTPSVSMPASGHTRTIDATRQTEFTQAYLLNHFWT
jgi:hypothetical protein